MLGPRFLQYKGLSTNNDQNRLYYHDNSYQFTGTRNKYFLPPLLCLNYCQNVTTGLRVTGTKSDTLIQKCLYRGQTADGISIPPPTFLSLMVPGLPAIFHGSEFSVSGKDLGAVFNDVEEQLEGN